MRASGDERPCQEAVGYYYDLLSQEDATVPASIRSHVETCAACQGQMHRLRAILSEAQVDLRPGGSGAEEELVAALARQFQLLDAPAACSDVKPFLPALLPAAPPIRIPTPVTVHVDCCPCCAEDLATLGRLNLTASQLQRLARLFEQSAHPNARKCRKARSVIGALSRFSFEGADVQTRNHLSTCPHCRAQVYQQREQRLATIRESGQTPQTTVCDNLSAADLFDFAVPYDLPDQGQEDVAAHVRTCPACLEKVQILHRTICEIAERANSGTTTVYHAEDRVDGSQEGGDEASQRYPVHVQVLHEASPGAAADHAGLAGDQAPPARRSRVPTSGALARVAVVATIGIMLAVFPRPNAPTASGTNAGDVLKALAKAENVHVVSTAARGNGKPFQELWIARHSEVLVRRTAKACLLYDLPHYRKRTIEPQTGAIVSARLEKDECDLARELMTSCLLDTLMQVSPKTRLHRTTSDPGSGAARPLDVYELPPAQNARNSSAASRWWAYIDPTTGLPQRVEFYRKGPRETEWQLSIITTFAYLTKPEMDDSIQMLFPPD